MLDSLVRGVILILCLAFYILLAGLPGLAEVGLGLLLVVAFVLEWVYGAATEVLMQGRSPGKLLLGLRVVRVDGSPADTGELVLRNLLRFVDWMPALFGLAWVCMAADPSLRRVGDLVAGTMVIVDRRASAPTQLRLSPPVTDEERRRLPVRVALSPDAMRAIEALMRRAPRLSPERVEELAALLAPQISARTGVVAPTSWRVLQLAWARAAGQIA
jgi:uncharacterized RDD family membrane protein YckC